METLRILFRMGTGQFWLRCRGENGGWGWRGEDSWHLLHPKCGAYSLPPPPLSQPGAASSLPCSAPLPQLASISTQVSPPVLGYQAPPLRQRRGTPASSTQQGGLFQDSLIRETIGGWEGGKTEVVDTSCPVKTAPGSPRGRGTGEGSGGQRAPCTLCPSPSSAWLLHLYMNPPLPVQLVTCWGTRQGARLVQWKGNEGPELKILALCLVSCGTPGKLIALGLSFLFCTISRIIPTLQGGCCKD